MRFYGIMCILWYYIGVKYSILYFVQYAQKSYINFVQNTVVFWFLLCYNQYIKIKYDLFNRSSIKHRVFTDFYTVYSIKVKYINRECVTRKTRIKHEKFKQN